MEESEILDFLSNPIAWKDYSSQTFRYTPAAGNWTLLITNTNQNLGTRIKSAKMIFNVAWNYSCHEGCQWCYDYNGCAGECDHGYDFYDSDKCVKSIEHCVEQEGDICLECEEPTYWEGWNWKFCTKCDKNCEVCNEDTLDCYSCWEGYWVDYKTKRCTNEWPSDMVCDSIENCFEMSKDCAAV